MLSTLLSHNVFSLIGGKLGFYYKEHEIIPPLPGGCLIVALIKYLH